MNMNKLISRFLILTFCVLFAVNSAAAWDEIGHKLSAYIAWERMTPEVRGKVVKILLDAPEDSDLNVLYDAYNSRSKAIKERELFMYAAIWSDVVRNRDFEVRYKNYNQGDWHYADIFWKQENGEAIILPDFPVASGKAIPKLYDFEKILRDSSYSNKEKAIALAWFLHVGGDIHNPVHNGSRVTETEPKGDSGGNMFILQKPAGDQRGTNLHAFWDGIIGKVIPRKNDACDSDYLAPIAASMIKKYPYAKMQNRLNLSNYKAWNVEGFDLLSKVVYPKDLQREQMPSEKYRRQTFDVSEEQLTLAGYRLGETLNKIFSGDLPQVKTAAADSPKLSQKDAFDIWNKIREIIDNNQPFKYIRIEVTDATVTLKGIIADAKLKKQAVAAIEKIQGVEKVVDLIEVDETISDKTAENKVMFSGIIPAETVQENPALCRVIRRVIYPVSAKGTSAQKMQIALLDICPNDTSTNSRPKISIISEGKAAMFEYDIVKVFKNKNEARKYAEENNIGNISFK